MPKKSSPAIGSARPATPPAPVPVSVETGLAQELQLKLGDELVFDVQGVPVRTVVASLREVNWLRPQPNFFMLFPRGVLEEAPSIYVLVTRVDSARNPPSCSGTWCRPFPMSRSLI